MVCQATTTLLGTQLALFGDKTSKIPEVKVVPKMGKIPDITFPVPSPFFGVFWGKNLKNPRNLHDPHPQNGGFSGKKPQKTPKLNLSPSPKNPQNFFKLCPRPHPVPEIRGRGRGKTGMGPRSPTLVQIFQKRYCEALQVKGVQKYKLSKLEN